MSRDKRYLPDRKNYRVVGRLPPELPANADTLTSAEEHFVQQYLVDLSPSGAAERAGFPPEHGRKLLAERRIQDSISQAKKRRASNLNIRPYDVLRHWAAIVKADVRDIIKIIYINCRHCWGEDHHYQFRDEDELEEKRLEHESQQRKIPSEDRTPFDERGGIGFDLLRDPCRGPSWVARGFRGHVNATHNCPHCYGLGERMVWLEDGRYYNESAVVLYDGLKISRDGSVEVKVRNRDQALERVAQHLGMLNSPKNGAPPIDPSLLTDEQLDDVLSKFSDRLDQKLVLEGEFKTPAAHDEPVE